ncbi:thiopeptide-type bacteriocin biosynthesis protein [Pseudonocardia acaciae]|uniref:thiopeptide-type bacteriocin biosynthesis protein n=1 Tax=Pseudonocardia acaciae TaxID=551276 RepID=UPI000567314D|nr:thiopeptide-type bacteriocin biosynthesis protein [Pseudonocardia acaciae]
MNEITDQTNPDPVWGQVSLWCANWRAAEQMATTHLRPQLARAEDSGELARWWFVRKATCWRVRYLPRPGRDDQARAHVGRIMRGLAAEGAVTRWAPTLYEPETRAFGGPAGMDLAHELFHADSHHLLNHLHRQGDRHRAELGVLLACELMRGAGQDHYEQGDIWAQLGAHRPATRPPVATEIDSVHRLLTGRATSSLCDPTWLAAFRDTGAALTDLAHEGGLTRGLRAVLTHHVLFAWNRAGISSHTQALLAQAAAAAVFDRELDPPRAVDDQPAHNRHR